MNWIINFIFGDENSVYLICIYLLINTMVFLLLFVRNKSKPIKISFKLLIFLLNILSLILSVAVYEKYNIFMVLASFIMTSFSIYIVIKSEIILNYRGRNPL
jgi:hypothetical protein